MDIRTYGSAAGLVRQILDPKTATTPVMETPPQKPAFRQTAVCRPFPRKTPEEVGLSSAHIADYLRTLAAERSLNMHSILILKDGAVVTEADFGPYDHRIWHVTHSQCKSLTGLAIGMLMDEGKLMPDEPVADIFREEMSRFAQFTGRGLTVRHLLSMTAGVMFNESGSVTEPDWQKGFLESLLKMEPGRQFMYNSMNTYMLSCIVKKRSGQGLAAYLTPRLFRPMGIENLFWEKSPTGQEKGGWGLYILPENMAKIGYLVLCDGVWDGKQLISHDYLKLATSVQAHTPRETCAYDYGWQIWVGRERDSFLFNGMFGQNVLGFRDSGVLVVCTAGNSELFQQSAYYGITERFFAPAYCRAAALPENRAGHRALRDTLRQIRGGTVAELPWHGERGLRRRLCRALSGKCFAFQTENAASVGLMPLIVQAVQNNYTRGLRGCAFVYEEKPDRLVLTMLEADARHVLPVGFTAPGHTELDFHGERHRVAVWGEVTTDEDGTPVLKVRVDFLEIANSRILKFFLYGDKIELRLSELPGEDFALSGLASLKPGSGHHSALDNLLDLADGDYARYKLHTVFSPVLELFPVESERNL